MRLLINLVPHISMDPRGSYQRNMGLITVMSEYGIGPSSKQSHPRSSMLAERCNYFEFGLMQSSMVWCLWLSKYISIMSANLEVTLAWFKMSMMNLIELWSWSTRPESVHLVRCFEISCICTVDICWWCSLPKARVRSCSHTIQKPVLWWMGGKFLDIQR